MKTLHIIIQNKIATYQKRDGDIVCGNSDYQVEFIFDSEWDGYTDKTARFIWNDRHYDVPIRDGVCRVPTVSNTDTLTVGVYSGDLFTTTASTINTKRSIRCGSTTPAGDKDKPYADEAKEAAARAVEAAERAEDAADRAEEAAENAVGGGGTGENGATFTPSVSTDGVISWTNDKGLANPQSVNIKGTDGKDYVLTEADKIEIASLVDETTIIPDYWISELENKTDAIQTAMEKAGKNKSAFLWYTDAHWVNGNSKISPKLLNYLYMNTPMNKVNFGGDIIGDTLLATREEMKYLYEWRKAIKDLPNHHSVFGNHDMFDLSSVDYEDDNYRYAFLLAPEETPDQVWGDGNYYYIDNPAEKTRYLYIAYLVGDGDAMMKQGQFICDAIKTVDEGWHIVAIAHRWWQYSASSTPTTGSISAYEAEILSVFDAYNARETRSGSNFFYTQDFSQGKGKVEFCIGGHIHVDYDIESEGGIPIIITTSDTNQNRVPDSTVDSGTIGTITEAAVYGIIADYNDPNNTKITVVGVGRGTSRVISGSQTAYPYAISDVEYFGDKTVGATIDVSKFSFTVHYTNGSSVEKTGISSVNPSTIQEGQYVYVLLYSEMGSDTPCDFTIISEAAVATNLLNLDRTYVTGTVGESIGTSYPSYLDESKAYTNVVQGNHAFNASACTVSGISEDGVTVKESGIGGMTVVYPVYLPDIGTKSYVLSFDYTGDGSSRVWYKYATANCVTDQNVSVVNKTGSGHIDYTIPASAGFAWLLIFVGANTGKTTTLSNVSLTEA